MSTSPPARNTRAATAAAAAAESQATPSPWAADLQDALSSIRQELTSHVDSRFNTLEQRNTATDARLDKLITLFEQDRVSREPEKERPASSVAADIPRPSVEHISVSASAPATPSHTSSTVPSVLSSSAPWDHRRNRFASSTLEADEDSSPAPQSSRNISFHMSSTPTTRTDSSQGSGRVFQIKSSDIGYFDGTPEHLEIFLSRVQAVAQSERDPGWVSALLRAMPLCLEAHAALWHASLNDQDRASLSSIARWSDELRLNFAAQPSISKRQARARTWAPDEEDLLGYVFSKTALLKHAFKGLKEADIVHDVVDPLPNDIQKLLKTPRDPHPTLVDLRHELRDQEHFWRVEHHRPLVRAAQLTGSLGSISRLANLANAPSASSASTSASTSEPARVHTTSTTTASAPPSRAVSRRPKGRPISEDFDPSRLDYATDPKSGKRLMRYRIPDTDDAMFCHRACRRCGGDHFDFAHEHFESQKQKSTASAHTAGLDYDYPHPPPLEKPPEPPPLPSTQSLLAPVRDDVDGSVVSKAHCNPPPADVSAEGCKSTVERVAAPVGPPVVLDGGYGSKFIASGSGGGTGPAPDQASTGEPQLFFADRPQFSTPRVLSVDESARPLAHETRRNGCIVVPPAGDSATGTGQAYRSHAPLTVQIRINDTSGPPVSSLLDTGASLSTIDESLLRELGGTPSGTPIRVNGLGNSETLGWSTITFFIAAKDSHSRDVFLEFTQDFHVLPHFAPGLCLGLDFICPQSISIDARHDRALTGRYSFPTTEKVPAPYAKDADLCTRAPCFIPARTSAWVPIDSACLAPGVDYTIHPRLTLSDDEEVQLCGPVAVASHGTSHVLLTNMGSRSINLPRRTPVADAVVAHLGEAVVDSGHTFSLGSPSSPGAVMAAMSAGDVWTVGDDGDEDEVAAPLDLFEGTNDPSHDLARDAATTVVDGHFKIGLDADGKPPQSIVDLLRRHKEAFALEGRPGLIKEAEMEIPLVPDASLRPEAPRRASPEKRAAMDAAIDQLLSWDVIEPSSSPVSFPVLMVRQYNKWRFCVDYRQLNAVTVADRYPLPTTDAVFQTLMGKKCFSSLDAIRGYHQMMVKPGDRWKTAFVCHRGLFQYKTVPFGLRNAPAGFQRLMDKILGELRWKEAVIYIDDTVIATETMEEHLRALETLLTRAAAAGLKFSPAKCTFAVPSLVLLGRKVSGAGVAVWDERARAVKDLPRPRTLQDLYHALGLFGYYRIFIRGFAELAEPLTRLTKGWRYEHIGGRTRLVDTTGQTASADKTTLDWGSEQEQSFSHLKSCIASAPVLAHPDPSRPYVLYVDASKKAFAAILHQVFSDVMPASPASSSAAMLNAVEFGGLPPKVAKERWSAWVRADPVFRAAYHRAKSSADADWTVREDILIRRSDGKISLPIAAIPLILRAEHDDKGHFGFTKTFLAVSRHFWRPRLLDVVRSWIRHCQACLATKLNPKVGEMDISSDPTLPFEDIATDIVLGLPRTRSGNDAVLVIQDIFSRIILLHPCSSTIDSPGIASILSDRVACAASWLAAETPDLRFGGSHDGIGDAGGCGLVGCYPDTFASPSPTSQYRGTLHPDRRAGLAVDESGESCRLGPSSGAGG
ncbi:hypothetical protein A4X13_0g7564 [Tilletia indica]|uniref:Uncharacterized protein n=1 Tax=Tilletia indica TaxID=43049 RepID=A0A177T518_9BASI|nr:hypothetical protein A4X13_0g7564 [Tilletia indica]